MNNFSFSSIKHAAKRVLSAYYFKCVLASFITGTAVSLVFSFIVDGSMQVENAFDIQAFYKAVAEAKSTQDIYNYIYSSIESVVSAVGYDVYSRMLARFALAMVLSFILQLVYRFLVVLPFEVGSCRFYMDSFHTEPSYTKLVSGFSSNYLNVVKVQLLRQLKVFLWSLLFLIPGTVKSYETFMVPYLLAENPDISSSEAFRLSRLMMYGYKLEVFLLNLSFIGWIFLSVITNGIAYIFFVCPYYSAALANVALRIKAAYNTPVQA